VRIVVPGPWREHAGVTFGIQQEDLEGVPVMLRRFVCPTAVACALLLPAAASASRPLVATDGVEATSPTTARVEGNADPEGQKTTLRAFFALASSQWCTSGGAKGKVSKTAPIKLGSGHVMYSEILVPLTGLEPNQNYCTELVARNMSGVARGGLLSFMTPSEG
jgi:hypothetical protein